MVSFELLSYEEQRDSDRATQTVKSTKNLVFTQVLNSQLEGSAVDHHRLRRAVEDPHCVDESNVVTGDDSEGASDVRVAPDDAPHDDRAKSGKRSDGARRKLKPIDEAQVGRAIFGPDIRPKRPARECEKVLCHSSLTDRCAPTGFSYTYPLIYRKFPSVPKIFQQVMGNNPR